MGSEYWKWNIKTSFLSFQSSCWRWLVWRRMHIMQHQIFPPSPNKQLRATPFSSLRIPQFTTSLGMLSLPIRIWKKLYLINLGLQYIEEGAFIGQDKLELFLSFSNWNLHIPPDLGPPTQLLITILWWQTLPPREGITFPYFAAFGKLTHLNIGGDYLTTFRPNLLPRSLLEINLW